MKGVHQIIRKPLVTEKAARLTEKQNKVVFEVDRAADKVEIRHAVERMFDVKVIAVRTLSPHGKVKRLGMRQGRRPDWKKAIVTLRQGDKIQFFEGA